MDWFFQRLDGFIKRRISSNIQLELIFAVAFCLVLAFLSYNITYNATRKVIEHQFISYETGISNISSSAYDIAERMLNDLRYKREEDITEAMRRNIRYASENNPEAKQFELTQAMRNLIDDFSRVPNLKVMVTNLDGEILFKTDNVYESQVDIFEVIKGAYDINYAQMQGVSDSENPKELTFVYPMNFLDADIFLIIRDTPVATIDRQYSYSHNESLAILMGLLFFLAGFMFLTKNKMDYIQELSDTVKIISTGNLKYTASVKGNDEITNLAKSINSMAKEIDVRLEEERKVEQMKHDLITNVSHDLRTPLTSIIGYLGLAKSDATAKEKQGEYLNIAYAKSERLKELINELFEYSKLQSPEKKPSLALVNIREVLDQLLEEMIPMAEERQLTIEKDFPRRDILVPADVTQLVRVFENLISNALKYAKGNAPILVRLREDAGDHHVRIDFENAVDTLDEGETQRMFERFYRLEKSRSSETGGSGLGLAISETIVKNHNGRIHAWKKDENTLCITVELPGHNA